MFYKFHYISLSTCFQSWGLYTNSINPKEVTVTRAELDTAADATGLELVVLDGLDEAIVGYNPGFGDVEPCVVYDYDKIIEVFMKNGMSYEEACEWVDYNVIGLKLGDSTPLIIKTKL